MTLVRFAKNTLTMLSVTTLVLGSRLAVAQPTADQPSTDGKSETTALELSASGAALGVGMMAGGVSLVRLGHGDAGAELVLASLPTLLVAPSAGQLYSGQYLTLGMGVRVVGMSALIYGAGLSAAKGFTCGAIVAGGDAPSASNCTDKRGDVITDIGLAVLAAGAIYDIATAPHAACTRNHKHGMTAQLAPIMTPTANGGVAGGVGLAGAF
jgi:hypothetical protein